jgi:hypothetical protein
MKLIYDQLRDKETNKLELYDLGVDPNEKQNLSESRAAEAEAMRAMVEQHRKEGVKARRTAVEEVNLDEATKAQLRALGYLPDK